MTDYTFLGIVLVLSRVRNVLRCATVFNGLLLFIWAIPQTVAVPAARVWFFFGVTLVFAGTAFIIDLFISYGPVRRRYDSIKAWVDKEDQRAARE